MSWDIDPPEVRQVVGRSGEIAQGFEGDLKAAGEALQAAAAQTDSPLVNQALADASESQRADVSGIFQRTTSALRGVTEATKALVQGDEEMAANAQRNAAAAPEAAEMPRGGGDPR